LRECLRGGGAQWRVPARAHLREQRVEARLGVGQRGGGVRVPGGGGLDPFAQPVLVGGRLRRRRLGRGRRRLGWGGGRAPEQAGQPIEQRHATSTSTSSLRSTSWRTSCTAPRARSPLRWTVRSASAS